VGELSEELEDISESVLSGEENSDSAIRRERLLDLRAGVLIEALGMLDISLVVVLGSLVMGLFPGGLGPPTSRDLLTPLESNLVTFVLTMLTASTYSPKSSCQKDCTKGREDGGETPASLRNIGTLVWEK
jgi:hypothetical protein